MRRFGKRPTSSILFLNGFYATSLLVRLELRLHLHEMSKSGSHQTPRWRKADSNLYGAFPVKWCFRFIASSLFGAGKAVLRPVACDQVPGARGRGQGNETLAQLGGLPP